MGVKNKQLFVFKSRLILPDGMFILRTTACGDIIEYCAHNAQGMIFHTLVG